MQCTVCKVQCGVGQYAFIPPYLVPVQIFGSEIQRAGIARVLFLPQGCGVGNGRTKPRPAARL